MKTTKLDIHAAINMNAGEIVGEDTFGNPVSVDLKTAFKLAQDYNFLWGYYYPDWADCLAGVENYRSMTKKEFKRRYSSLRRYHREMYEISQFGGGGLNL